MLPGGNLQKANKKAVHTSAAEIAIYYEALCQWRLRMTGVLAFPNSWVRFESDYCRMSAHISMLDAEQSQTGQ